MGAWGVGMQASDDALDAIAPHRAGKDPIDDANYDDVVPDLIVDAALAEAETDGAMGALGLAEWLIDKKVDVSASRERIERLIDYELGAEQLDDWRDPAARRDALERFRRRVLGTATAADLKATELDNRGLLSKIYDSVPEDD